MSDSIAEANKQCRMFGHRFEDIPRTLVQKLLRRRTARCNVCGCVKETRRKSRRYIYPEDES